MAEKCINRNGSEKVSNVQKTNPKTATETRKEGLKKYTDMAIDPARLVPKMCHHNLPTLLRPC